VLDTQTILNCIGFSKFLTVLESHFDNAKHVSSTLVLFQLVPWNITFFKGGPTEPSQQWKQHQWFLSMFDSCPQKIEVTSKEALCTVKKLWGSLLKPLLTCCDQYSREKNLWGHYWGQPCSGLKNVMKFTVNYKKMHVLLPWKLSWVWTESHCPSTHVVQSSSCWALCIVHYKRLSPGYDTVTVSEDST
jgi:hypothetical protein